VTISTRWSRRSRALDRAGGEQGNGLALTGLILGYVGTVGVALLAGLLILFFVVVFRPS
jgi:hypothetical protein